MPIIDPEGMMWPRVLPALALLAAIGCSRTPAHPVAADNEPSQRLAIPDAKPLRPEGAEAAIRDDSVKPASLVVVEPAPKSEQELAAEALGRIGPPAVPMLREALRSTDDEVRRQALVVLLKMGPDAKEAVPELVALLGDDDEDIRRMAAKALGQIGPDAADAVPSLMRQMLDARPTAEL